MSQHHLHSALARSFTQRDINKMSDTEIHACFRLARWGSDTEQGCPRCGSFRQHNRRKHDRWRCADCGHEFSVTSGTLLHSRKLPLREILLLAMTYECGAKGTPILHTSRATGVTPKTAQVFNGKVRESLIKNHSLSPLAGSVVHMDGGYFCGKPRRPRVRMRPTAEAIEQKLQASTSGARPRPWATAGITRLNWMKRKNRRVVIAMCQSAGIGHGSNRVIPVICGAESEEFVRRAADAFIDRNATVMTDEAVGFTALDEKWTHETVCHKDEYATIEGVSDNMCETFFSRLRQLERVNRGMRPKYLQDYSIDAAWREENRKLSQRERVEALLKLLLTSKPSAWWRGYWQGRHRKGELGLEDMIALAAARNPDGSDLSVN